ncbi:MAG: hypothetical protein H7Z39_05420 [Burkholderiaceae bacterium]|nr:hypothetical protein [Burkholderiaceae bacterium]
MNTPYSAELFAPHVGSAFVFQTEDGAQHALTLDQVESKRALNGAAFHVFTLFFSSPKAAFFEQGSYLLRHPELGQHTIFLNAIGETASHFRYQAPFSVQKEASLAQ